MASAIAAAASLVPALRALLPHPRAFAPSCLARQQSVAVRRRPQCTAAAALPEDEIEPVPPALLSNLSSADELAEEAGWLAGMVRCWADEEWAAAELEPIHADLGAAAGKAYLRLRQQQGSVQDMGDLVLGLAAELMGAFDFGPTFTSAFEVSNKCVELLMLRQGCDVCCTSEADRTAIQRFEAALAAESGGGGGASSAGA